MKFLSYIFTCLFLCFGWGLWAQNPVTVTATVMQSDTNQPLEYASVTFTSENDPSNITGDLTNEQGMVQVPVTPDTYTISIEFLGFKTVTLLHQTITTSVHLGTIKIDADAQVLEGLVIEAQRSPVEIKLDKKIYNVGNDNVLKGGTAGDVLDNVPSVSVDSDGNVSLRGNESVKVLIDGKPSGMASNIADALKMLSAESIDKVEVITNPSARYEAEGGAGIINIILKKGSNSGLNGSVTATATDPKGYSVATNLNYKEENFNVFANLSYRDNKTYGNSLNETQYKDANSGNTTQYVDEYTKRIRNRDGLSTNLGFEWNLTKKLTWNNTLNWRRGNGDNPSQVMYNNYDAQRNFLYSNIRQTLEDDSNENVDYSTDFTYKFNDKGHQLFVSGTVSKSFDDEDSTIATYNTQNISNALSRDITKAKENELNHILRADYTLPLSEDAHFEAGYLGNFNNLSTKYDVQNLENGVMVENPKFKNDLEYIEKVHALYAQYGSKWDKLSYMLGLRWEATEIDVNQLVTNNFNNKPYNNFFPSVFLNYQLSETTNTSLSYSRRVRRPRGRMLNPISNYSSSINFFMGNPNLDPSFTDAFDLGFMKRWGRLTLNSSAYFNRTTDAFQFVRRIDGVNEEGIPVTISSPINLNTEYRYGVEFNFNYNPTKWLRMNGNLNLYQQQTRGDYTFIDFDGKPVYENFDFDAFNWSGRFTARVTLPAAIEWQTNYMYFAGSKTSQGKSLDFHSINMALSKDLFKEKATLSLNVQDLLNTRKRMMYIDLPTASTYTEMQWRERTVNVSFTYRFNQSKKEAQKQRRATPDDDQEEMASL